VLIAASVVVGCGKPTPEKVCGKAVELSSHLVESECVSTLKKQQTSSPSTYSKTIDCISAAKNAASVEACLRAVDAADAPNTTGSKGPSKPLPVITFKPGEIDGIVLKARSKAEVSLTKQGDTWRVSGANAKKSAVDDLLATAATCSVKEEIAVGKNSFTTYDLTGESAIHFVAKKGAVVVLDVYLGKQASRGQMARIGDDDRVFTVGGCSAFSFDKEPGDFRE
jgi:hypothetical protein